MKKLKVGLFSYTCCEGCQLQLFEAEEEFPCIAEIIDWNYFRLLKEKNKVRKMDIAIVEGSISHKKSAHALKSVRRNCAHLIAIGACATSGGVNALRNKLPLEERKHLENFTKGTTPVFPVRKFVKVDFELKGCPIDEQEFVELLFSLSHGVKMKPKALSVCKECRHAELDCLLLRGKACLGSVSHAGCKAICITQGTECDACRGLSQDANLKKLKKMLRELGYSGKEIGDRICKYNLEEK